MADFEAVISAQLDGATVRCAPLVRFNFVSGAERLWPGAGPLSTVDPQVGTVQQWRGIGNLGSLSVLEAGVGQVASERTYTLFGSDDLLSSMAADAAEATGQPVYDYLQFFDVRELDDDGNWVEWQPLGDPFQVWWGVMSDLVADRPRVVPGDRITRSVSVRAQNAFTNRRRPPNAFYSDRDQRARSAGDAIFVAMASANRTIRWPVFA